VLATFADRAVWRCSNAMRLIGKLCRSNVKQRLFRRFMWSFSHHLLCKKHARQLDHHRFHFTTQPTTGRLSSLFMSVVARQAVYLRVWFPQAGSRNHCCHGKAISITYSECVSVDLLIQHAKLMRHFVFSSVPCAALLKFSALSHKNFVNVWPCKHCSDPE